MVGPKKKVQFDPTKNLNVKKNDVFILSTLNKESVH